MGVATSSYNHQPLQLSPGSIVEQSLDYFLSLTHKLTLQRPLQSTSRTCRPKLIPWLWALIPWLWALCPKLLPTYKASLGCWFACILLRLILNPTSSSWSRSTISLSWSSDPIVAPDSLRSGECESSPKLCSLRPIR